MEDSNVCSNEDTQGAVEENNEKLASSYNTILDDDSAIDYSGEIRSSNDLAIGAIDYSGEIRSSNDLVIGAIDYSGEIEIVGSSHSLKYNDISFTVEDVPAGQTPTLKLSGTASYAFYYSVYKGSSTSGSVIALNVLIKSSAAPDPSSYNLDSSIGSHTILIQYDYYGWTNLGTITYTVSKITPVITITKTGDINYGATEDVSVSISPSLAGDVKIALNTGESYTNTITAGTSASAKFSNLKEGDYILTATFTPSDTTNYNTVSKTETFKVSKITPTFVLTNPSGLKAGQSGTINLNLTGGMTGNITVNVTDKFKYSKTYEYKDQTYGDSLSISTDELAAGTYYVTATYSGDDKYSNATITDVPFDVGKLDTELELVAPGVIDINTKATISVKLPVNATGKVTIKVNGVSYEVDAKDGIAATETNVFGTAGTYEITAEYEGNTNYTTNKTTGSLVVRHVVYVDYDNGDDAANSGTSWDDAVKTISQANTIISGYTEGTSAVIYLADGTHKVETSVAISRPVTIIGNSTRAVITNEKSDTSVLTISSKNVEIYNCTFANNTVNTGSAAVCITKDANNVSIVNCNFVNNSVTKENTAGGAIQVYGANCTIVNSTFVNNTAPADVAGAIYIDSANCTIKDSTFENNSAKNNGGAIFITSNALNTTFVNSTFINNTASIFGGAIYSNGINSIVMNSNFINNTATNNGGAIYSTKENLTVANSTFTNNYVSIGDTSVDNNYFGGAIYISGANSTVANSSFVNNSAKYGGAIYTNGVNSTIVNSNFTINNAITSGGSIYIKNANSTVVNSSFVNNTASFAGAVYIQGNNTVIDNSTFINNTATNGGAIATNENNGNSSILNSTFINNTAVNGGAIRNWGKDVSVVNSSFVNNSAFADTSSTSAYGGAICNSDIGVNLLIDNSRFENNFAYSSSSASYGGAIYIHDSKTSGEDMNVTCYNSTFINNTADNGGAIYNVATGTNISGSYFEKNKANMSKSNHGYGGAIYNNYVVKECTVENSTFIENSASYGGAIRDGGVITIDNSTFEKNTAGSNGGAVYVAGENAVSTIANSTFEKNNATTNGGAIYVDSKGSSTIANSTFIENRAINNVGGAIYTEGTASIDNSTFVSNSAVAGGAVYVLKDAKSNITDSTFESNKATGGENSGKGGAIYNSGNVSVINSTFTKNTAGSHGGAISMISAQAGSIVNSTFKENSAIWGGAINNKETHGLVIDNCTFTQNSAKSTTEANPCGGAIDNDNANNVVINNSVFKNNELTKNSKGQTQGGITIFNTGTGLTIDNCTFESNNGYGDGIVRNIKEGLTVVNSSFKSNTLNSGNGGAIYNIGNNLKVDNTTFEQNTGAVGGAVYNKATGAVIKNSTFKSNTATVNGIIYNDAGSNLTIQNSTFEGNSVDNNGKGIVAYNQKNAYLTLENNTYPTISGITHIYNDGTIAKVNITVLGNTTHDVTYNQVITLFANITSDGASVSGQDLYFTLDTDDNKYKAAGYDNGTYSFDYTVKSMGNTTVSAVYGDSSSAATVQDVATGLLNASKGYTDLNVTVENITIGDVEFIIINVANDAEGTVTLTLNDTNKYNVTKSIYNGTVEFAIKGLAAGNYSVNVTYNGSPLYYNKTNDTATFKVSKLVPDFRADIVNITYGDNATIIINLPAGVTGKNLVNLTVNKTSYLVDITDGKGKLVLENLGVGVYDITANFTGDDNYSNMTIESKLEVTQYSAALDVVIDNVTYGQISTITAILTGPNRGLNGTVNVVISNSKGEKVGDTRYVKVENGRGVLSVENLILNAGDYTFTAMWNENSADNNNYTVSTDSGKFNVTKANIYIDADALNVIYGKDTTVKVNLSAKVSGTVTVKIDGENVDSIVVTDGVGEKTYDKKYNAGNHSVEVSFIDSNGNYNSTSDKCNFTVFKADPTVEVTVPGKDITFGDLTQTITIKLEPVSGGVLPEGTVTVTIDGKTYKVGDEFVTKDDLSSKSVTLTLDTLLAPGKHNISVTYNGDNNYTSVSVDDKFINVVKAAPELDVYVGRFDGSAYITNVDYNQTFTIYVDDLTGICPGTGMNPVKLNGTVVFMINGTKYAVNVTDGVGSTTGIKLPAGKYSYNATWEGNENYTGILVSNKEFTVNKIGAPVNITAEDIVFGDDETITVKLPSDAAGDISIEVWDGGTNSVYSNSSAKLVNGMVTYVIPGLNAYSNYKVKVSYSNGNNYYLTGEKEGSFSVACANSTLNVAIGNVIYGEIAPVNATLTGVNNIGLNAKVTVTIYKYATEGADPEKVKSLTIDVKDGKYYSNALADLKLNAGNYTFEATWEYLDTDSYHNYNISSVSGSFAVYKITPAMDVTGTPVIYVGDNEKILVNLPDGALDNYDDLEFEIKHNNGDYSKCTYTYSDDGYYVLSDLKYGNYSLIVKYKGNTNYLNTSAGYNFVVSKISKNMTLATSNIEYGKDASVEITLPDSIGGNVDVYVDGKKLDDTYSIDSTNNKVSISNLGVGSHSVEVVYNGNEKYSATNGVCNINVTKATPESLVVTIKPDSVDYNKTFTIHVTALNGIYKVSGGDPEKLSGNVLVTVSKNNNAVGTYVVPVKNGEGSLSDLKLPAGSYTFTAKYDGNDNYTDIQTTGTFTVNKINPTVEIITENIVFGDDENIIVKLPGDITGSVTITVNDDSRVVDIVNGFANATFSGLNAADSYKVTVNYDGTNDNNYNSINAEKSFSVARANSTLNVAIGNVIYGEIAPVNATLTGVNNIGLNAKVTVNIYNKDDTSAGIVKSLTIDVNDGKYYSNTLNNLKLNAGNYTFEASWTPEEGNYNKSSMTGSFAVYKITPTIEVTGTPVIYVGSPEKITITLSDSIVPASSNIEVTVTKDGNSYDVTNSISWDSGSFTLSDLPYGNYSVVVKYKGDTNYNSVSTGYNFLVSKISKNMTISAENIVYGNTANIEITLPDGSKSGSVYVSVDGKDAEEKTFTEGIISFNDLSAGSHSFEITYNGDDTYTATTGVCNINVTKAKPELDVSIADVNYNNIFTITVNSLKGVNNEKLSGNVIVTVNGKDYVVYVENGKGSTDGIKLPANDCYTFTAKYGGNDNYTDVDYSGSFKVNKIDADVVITSENIVYGDNEVITIELPSDATGKLTITVLDENNEVAYTSTDDLVNGKVTYTIPGLNANINGKYNIKLTYADDNNYNIIEGKLYADNSFTVARANSTLNVVVDDVDYRQTSDMVITLDGVNEKLSGDVKITIYENGEIAKDSEGRELKDISVNVEEGTASLNTIKLAAGSYTFSASYESTNANYNSSEYKGSFAVRQITPDIEINGTPFIYGGEDETINITLPDDVTGEVSITFNGTTTTYTVEQAKSITFEKVSVGNYTVEVTYLGDKNFTGVFATYDFTVLKITPELDITTEVIVYGDNETVSVKLPGDAIGYVNLTVDGKYYATIDLEDGAGSVNVTGLSAGLHYFVFDYSGDVKYNEASALRDINVSKADPALNIKIEDILYNNIFKISAALDGVYNEKLTGIVVVTVDGKKYYVEVTDGEGILDGIKLPVANYNFTASWDGNSNYNSTTFNGSFNIAKINASVDISKSNITFGENETVTVTLPGDITGSVTIKVDDDYYTVAIVNGVATKVLSGLNAGDHTLDITYNGDNNYNNFTNSTKFNVAKADSVLDVAIDSVYCDEIAVITALLTGVNGAGLTGDVIITINNTPYTVSVVNGKVVSKQLVLGAGEYNFTAFWSGNSNYNNASANGTFTVSKLTPDITLLVNDVLFGYDISLNTILPNTATGNITVFVDGEFYSNVTLDGRFANELIKGLDAGVHNITVVYNGDDKYTVNNITKAVNVFNANPGLNVVIGNVKYGEIFTIDAFLTGANVNLNGNVTVVVNNVIYTVEVVDGKGSVSGVKLDKGTYNFTAYYGGAKNYNSAEDKGSFVVSEITKGMYINVEDINVGEDAVITVTLPEDATDNVSITVNGVTYSVEVIKGTATKVISNLGAKSYVVEASYPGDSNYGTMSAKESFTVSKLDSVIDIVTNNIVFGGNEIITVNLPGDASGTVVLTVNNQTYELTLVNGRATQIISGLNAGNIYNVKAEYSGNDKYNPVTGKSSFSVDRANVGFNVIISDVSYGEVSEIIAAVTGINGACLNGYVLVNINGTQKVVDVVNGIGKLSDLKLAAGLYNFTATWQENNNYNSASVNGSFKVNKINPTISVSVDDINAGEDAVIKVTSGDNVTGNVTFDLGGKPYTLEFVNGVAVKSVSNLAADKYAFTLTYNGDNNYNSISKDVEFVVSKLASGLNIDITDVKFGENGTVDVYFADGADGNVNITVAGKSYIVSIENGKASAVIDVLDAGNYTVSVKYEGNDKYAGDYGTGLLSVAKANVFLGVSIDNVDYGSVFKITAVLTGVNNTGLTGTVIVKVDGKDYVVYVVDGTGYLDGVKLNADKYEFSAYYPETQNYNAASDSGVFSVFKVTPAIDVNIEDGVITVTLPDDVSENVTVKVNNQTYSVEVIKGTATKTIADIGAGKYTVSVSYDGDDNYNSNAVSKTFTVSKADPVMDITVNNIVFGENEVITINIPDATGNVVLTVNNQTYDLTLVNGRATQIISGLNASSIYKVKAEYSGDDNYNPVTGKGSFSVARANPNLNVVIDDVSYGSASVIIATLGGVNGSSLTGYVFVNINGTQKVVNVVNGIGKLDDVKLAAGLYNFTANWQENNNYNSAGVNGSFKVSKTTPTINVSVENIKVGEDAVVKLTASKDVSGNVTFELDGKPYTLEFVNGVAAASVSNLAADTYTFTLTYNGDSNYNSVSKDVEFVVSKISSDMNIGAADIIFGENTTVFANLNTDAGGNITVTVDGVTYTAEVEKGAASIDISGLNTGNHTVVVKYNGDEKYFDNTLSTVFNVAKANPTLNVNIADVKYGEIFEISAVLNGVSNTPLNGVVVVNVEGRQYAVSVKDGAGSIDGTGLPAGIYTFTASWEGNNNYNSADVSGGFEVLDAKSVIDISVDSVDVGETVTITVKLPDGATGNVTADINGINYNVESEDGVAVISVPNLKANTYDVVVNYLGDDNFDPVVGYTSFTVSKISDYNASVDVPSEVKEGENTTVTMDLPDDATGNVTVTVDGKNYTVLVKNGTVNITVPALDAGVHNITATYSGDDKYNPVTKTAGVNVTKKDAVLSLDDVVMYYHDGTRLTCVLTDVNGNPIANKTVTFTVNGLVYNKTTDADGSASIAINLDSGIYNASVTYGSLVSKANVVVKSSIIGSDIVKMYKNDTQFYATFIGENGEVLANADVMFNINNMSYKRTTDADGTVKFSINLDPGSYVLTTVNPFNNESRSFNILVKSLIETGDLTKYYMNASGFVAKIYNKDGSLAVNKSVRFNINGVFYTRTSDANGIVKLSINLIPGEYIITSMYEGLSVGNNVKVLPTLETSDLSMKYGDGSKFIVKTLDGEGNPLANQTITFNVNGVFYYKTTGNDGVASLNINLMRGEYIITSYWNNYQTGNKISIS